MRTAPSFLGAKVLITGGLGLIGSALARTLAQYDVELVLVDSLNDQLGGNLFNVEAIRDRVRINISDIRDKYGLRFLARNCDFIFNLAGQTSHIDSMVAPFEDLEINCQAQLSLMEVCRDVNPNVRIIYASTRQIYGRPQYVPVDEKHPVHPVDVNGINKVAGESYHRLYHEVYDLPTTVLRLTNTYGPGMRIRDARQMFLGIWIRRLLEGEPFEVWGGAQRRDFTYVDDVAEAFIAAAASPDTIGEILNVGGTPPMILRDVADLLLTANGGGSYEVREFPFDRQKIDIGDYYTDDRQFRRLTGWQPRVDLPSGLSKSIEFYRKHMAYYV